MVIVFSTNEVPAVMTVGGCGVSDVGQLLSWETHVNTLRSTVLFIVVMRLASCLILWNYVVGPVSVSGCMRLCVGCMWYGDPVSVLVMVSDL